MVSTISLLEKALEMRKAAQWSERFNITRATITMAKKKGRLSPTLAGAFAREIGADPVYWTAVAAYEAEPETPLKHLIAPYIERQKSKVSRHDRRFRMTVLSESISRAFVA